MIVKNAHDWAEFVRRGSDFDFNLHPQRITVEPDNGEPIDDCFAVFWIWAKQVAKKAKTTPQDIHDMWCNRFLGWTDGKTIMGEVIEPRLITLTYPRRKTKPEMIELLTKIDSWAADLGIYLITKATSEYMMYKESQA
jgi:hypothetical protein